VAQTNNESKTGTLPDAELNPLLNPLLAANMGRWAEVYFTNPPERRAQAVAELLRELESNPPNENATNSGANAGKTGNAKTLERPVEFRPDLLIRNSYSTKEETAPAENSDDAHELSRACESCGHSNSAGDRFCGMCGLPLRVTATTQQDFDDHQPPRQSSWHDQSIPQYGHPDSRNEIPIVHNSAYQSETSPRYERDYRQRTNVLPSFGTLTDNTPAETGYTAPTLFNYEPEEPPRSRHRLYIGIVLVIILGLLAYKTWLSNSTLWTRSAPAAVPQTVPQAGPDSGAPESSSTMPPAPAAPAAAPSSPEASAKNEAESTPVAIAPPSAGIAKPAATSRPVGVARPTPRKTSQAVNASGTPGEQSGVAELSLAQKYLNGASGTARDTQQAASWLWKSVAKQNPTATLLLSDLYLHGDGVPKSCDQARLLLDAAARKGNTAAVERLRNLPAFGCQ
jgi:hypothetical protein